MKKKIFFGASSGRTGTMHLANVLNAELDCTCLHEGKYRFREESGDQVLPFLTLENRIAYEYPEKRDEIIASKRSMINDLKVEESFFGDIAYNNSPFLESLASRFEDSKFIVMVRDGRTFVRSVIITEGENEAPVGWPPDDKPLTPMEKYISLGRLQPRKNDTHGADWANWSAFQKNTWLWAETNSLILNALDVIDPSRWMLVHFEQFVQNKLTTYIKMRDFLGFEGKITEAVKAVLLAPRINSRKHYALDKYELWTDFQKDFFWRTAGGIMTKFGYENDG